MLEIHHYSYVLSSWSYVAEEAIATVCKRFEGRISYHWHSVYTDYNGTGQIPREKLAFYYARLHAATGREMNLGWWRDGYDWTLPDRVVAAARLLGATGNEVRIALAEGALVHGEPVCERECAVEIACGAGRLDPHELRTQIDRPETLLWLYEEKRRFETTGIQLRPAFQMQNSIGDMAVLSGIWNVEPILAAAEALITDEDSYNSFLAQTSKQVQSTE